MNQPKPRHKRRVGGFSPGYQDMTKDGPTLRWYQKRLKVIEKEMRTSDKRDDAARKARALEIGALVAIDRTAIAHEAIRTADARRDAEETRAAIEAILARQAPPAAPKL